MIRPIISESPSFDGASIQGWLSKKMNQEGGTYKGEQTGSPSSSSIVSIILERSSIGSNNINSLFLEIFRSIRQHVPKGFEGVSEYCGIAGSSSAFLVSTSVYMLASNEVPQGASEARKEGE